MHEREKLRPTVDEDKDDFIHLVVQTMESIIKNTIPGAVSQMVETYWKTPKVSCAIVGSATEHSAVTATFALRSRGVLRLVLSHRIPPRRGARPPRPAYANLRGSGKARSGLVPRRSPWGQRRKCVDDAKTQRHSRRATSRTVVRCRFRRLARAPADRIRCRFNEGDGCMVRRGLCIASHP